MPAMPKPPTTTKPPSGSSAFDQFLAAERAQESGGNYKVVNSIGAAGAYQIMSYHIPDWSKAALGHSVSLQEFLSHPAEQDAIARYEFKPVYDAHGPRGAAAWWYSGSWKLANDYRPQKNGPSIGAYVDQVMARIGKSGSVTGGSGVTPADDVSGSGVTTAGLQQAGYEAVINLTPYGIPINPFKVPGWLAGKLGPQIGKDLTGGGSGMWDAIAPLVLGGIGLTFGAAVILLGLYVTTKPATDKAIQITEQAAPLAAAA